MQTLNPTTTPTPAPESNQWQLLLVFNLYRLFSAGALCALPFFDVYFSNHSHPKFYILISVGYIGFASLTLIALLAHRNHLFQQVTVQVFLDILVLICLIHASGGIQSSLTILFVPVIVAMNILAPQKISVLYTALASLGVLTEQIYTDFTSPLTFTSYSTAGFLGLALFITTGVIQILKRRLSHSVTIHHLQTATLKDLEKINNFIVRKMPTALLVIDDHDRIQIMNQAAQSLVHPSVSEDSIKLKNYSEALSRQVDQWRAHPIIPRSPFAITPQGPEVFADFISLEHSGSYRVLIFLDDLSSQQAKAQALKLASLGRLTASIAHEIRNPLSAIQHSAQLLNESLKLKPEDERLFKILLENSKRTNQIIENILNLSRKNNPNNIQVIALKRWLLTFIDQFKMSQPEISGSIELHMQDEHLKITFDSSQLQQILNNLVQNAIHHGHANDPNSSVTLQTGTEQTPYLEVIDQGPGISPAQEKFLFEPFFTTESKGTGLGLFIAKALAEANGTQLIYVRRSQGGGFRLNFPKIDRGKL